MLQSDYCVGFLAIQAGFCERVGVEPNRAQLDQPLIKHGLIENCQPQLVKGKHQVGADVGCLEVKRCTTKPKGGKDVVLAIERASLTLEKVLEQVARAALVSVEQLDVCADRNGHQAIPKEALVAGRLRMSEKT